MKIRDDTNENGVPVTVFECEYCKSRPPLGPFTP